MAVLTIVQEEKQFLQLCYEGTAPISEFRALIDRGVRLNIHDEVQNEPLTNNLWYLTPSMAVVLSFNAISLQKGNHPLWYVSCDGKSDLADLFIEHGAEVDLATDVRYNTYMCANK